jgi:hypothetical protein
MGHPPEIGYGIACYRSLSARTGAQTSKRHHCICSAEFKKLGMEDPLRRTYVSLIVLGHVLSLPVVAQTLTIRLLNGKTGKPISDKNVTVRWGKDSLNETVVSIDKNGIGTFDVQGQTEFSLTEGPRRGNEPYRIAYSDCNEPMYGKVQVKQALDAGYVPKNTCSRRTFNPKPGEVVFWGLPKPWWQLDFQ